MTPPRVALIGAAGHGLSHRRTLHRLAGAGVLEPAALCDLQPVDQEPLSGVPVYTDHAAMLAEVKPDVVIICTPPRTHLSIALDALAAGADVLLEKPPVTSAAEHRVLAAALADTGRLCQVGFQALGSAALDELVATRPSGDLAACGAWWRPDAYYTRAPWAGRRAAFDGALVNPFAHALMQALAIAPLRPVTMELERYRTREIEVDDTAFLRLTGADGRRLTVSVTLASAVFVAGEIHVGGAVLEYPTDRLRLPGEPELRPVPGRAGLLENLLDHRADRSVPLLVPLERTATFTAVAEAVVAAPPPALIDPRHLAGHPDGGGRVIPGVDELVRADGLPSERSVPWSRPPHRVNLA